MHRSTVITTLGAALLLALPLSAQEADVVGPSEVEAAMSEHHADADADREAVRRVLDTPEVQAVAEEMGVETSDLETAAGMLDGERLREAADYARDIEVQLAGGEGISISSTTLIVVLLLVVLIVIIAD